MLNDEIYAAILKEYKESVDEMFLTQFTYVGGLTPINSPKEKKTK